MIKAKFASKQQPVKVVDTEDKFYIFICLNGVVKLEDVNTNNNSSEEYIEYDYNEFTVNKTDIDINDIESNPEKYLNYTPDPNGKIDIEDIKKNKLIELSEMCEKTIFTGIDVELSIGLEHFSLTEKDQINLFGKQLQLSSGVEKIEYHEDGHACKYYSAKDMEKIIDTAFSYVSYNTTYCNALNMWVRGSHSIGEIYSIYWGIDATEIPSDYQNEVLMDYVYKI